MPKSKKQKTSHNLGHQPYSTRKNHQQSNGDNAAISHEEIWDDSALLRSWDDAVKEYEFYHSIHARGEDVDEVLRRADEVEEKERLDRLSATAAKADINNTSQNHDRNSSSSEDGEVSDNENQDPSDQDTVTKPATFPTTEAWHQSIRETPEYAAVCKVLGTSTEVPYPRRDDTQKADFDRVMEWLELMMGKTNSYDDIAARCLAAQNWLDDIYEQWDLEDKNGEASRSARVPDIVINNYLGAPPDAAAKVNGTANITINPTVYASTSAADQTLENIKMAYYWAGYYSGLYDGQRQAQSQEKKQ